MPSPHTSASNRPSVLICGNCDGELLRLTLGGHYGTRVEIDLCASCHLLWFDSLESARLSGVGLLALLGAMAQAQSEPHHALREQAACPRCGGGLKPVHNRSRWGPTLQLECLRGHGTWQSFAQFLSEKGFVRNLGSVDRVQLLRRDAQVACLNCGAPLNDSEADRCSYCGSVPGLVDVARLARALDPEGAVADAPVHRTASQPHTFNCHACGTAVPEVSALQCSHCNATQASADLQQAYAALRSLGPRLHAHQRKPAPHVKLRRLDALRSDPQRHRQWVRDMEAAAPQNDIDDPAGGWRQLLAHRRRTSGVEPAWVRVLFGLLAAALLAWWLGWNRE